MVKIVFLWAVIGFSMTNAMDLAVYARKKGSSIENLFKKFHLLSMEKMTECQHFSESQRQNIRNCLDMGKKHSTLFLFNIATTLPSELRKTIALNLLNYNGTQAQNFLEKPFWCSLDKYQASCEVMDGHSFPHVSKLILTPNAKLTIDIVFELFGDITGDDIAIADKILKPADKWHVCNGEELVAFSHILKLIPNDYKKNMSLLYAYRDTYTASNILKNISVIQWWGLVILGMPCISAFIEKKFCSKVLMQHLVEQNRCSVIKNEALMKEFQETGELFLLKDQCHLVDALKYSWLDHAKIMSPHLLTGLSCTVINEFLFWEASFKDILKIIKKDKRGTVFIVAMGMMPLLIFKTLFWILSDVSSIFDDQTMLHCSFLGAYVVGCVFYNLWDMSKGRNETVRLEDISKLLHNKNIVIE